MPRFVTGLRGWVEACHPYPLAAVVLLTGLIGVASSDGDGIAAGRLLLVLLAMLLSQLAIGWTNDYTDRETDRRLRPSKPLAAGRVDERLMPPAIAAAITGSLAAGLALGPLPLLLLVTGTVAGLAYDLWFKETRWSWAPFVVAFAVLPPYVWSSLGLFRTELAVLYVVALPLVPAVHVANVLPDMAADAAAGRRNLALIFGRGKALRAIAGCMAVPLILVLLSAPVIGYERRVLALALAVYLVLLAGATVAYLSRAEGLGFRLVVAASVLFAGGWLTAV